MDAGKYYALLRFEEASLALRAALKLDVVGRIGEESLTPSDFRERFSFTEQGARTFAALLEVAEVIQRRRGMISIAPRAKETLAENIPTSRRPYLSMGSGDETDALIEMLRGRFPESSLPLYGDEVSGNTTLMDVPDVGREIAFGLASRARNFAQPLAKAIAPHANKARIAADIGAGSPYVSVAIAEEIPHLSKVVLVDRANGMQYAKEMLENAEASKLEFAEQDFFQSVPAADIYCVSNTAHDWLQAEYTTIMKHVRDSIAPGGTVCVHEPLLLSTWNSAAEWVRALWMASYALTLYKLTEGKGTCYTVEEHDAVMRDCGFARISKPSETCDGCSALFYKLEADVSQPASIDPATQSRPQTY